MNDCFNAKFKDEVNNDNLDIVGYNKIHFNILENKTVEGSKSVGAVFSQQNGQLKITGITFSDDQTEKSGQFISANIEAQGAGYLYASDFITQFQIGDYEGDLKDFARWKTLTSLNLVAYEPSAGQVYGDLSSIEDLVNLTKLGIQSPIVTGDISSLGKMVNITEIDLRNHPTTIIGSIEQFVSEQRSNGRTTCAGVAIKMPATMSSVTFNNQTFGSIFTSESSVTLSWTASTITLGSTTINA